MSIRKNIFSVLFSISPRLTSFAVWIFALLLVAVGFFIDQGLGVLPQDYIPGKFFSDMTPGKWFVFVGAVLFILPFAVGIIGGIFKLLTNPKNGNDQKT